MRSILFFLFCLSAFVFSCNQPEPAEEQENAREQAIIQSDSLPQDHTGVSPDSTKNTPGMNMGK